MKPNHKKKSYIFLGIIISILVILLIISKQFRAVLSSPSLIREFILSFGAMAPLVIVVLQIIQAIFPILPGPIVVVIAGALFGAVKGTLYCLIGLSIGISLVFIISKKYGRSVIEDWIGEKEIKRFDAFFKKHNESYAIFLGRILPLFPNDVISFGAGLTKVRFKRFFIASMLGFIPGVFLFSLFGSKLMELININSIIILILILSSFIIIFKYKQKIHMFMHNLLLKLERKVKKAHIIVFVVLLLVLFVIYNNIGLEKYPANTFLGEHEVLGEIVRYNRDVMDGTQPFFFERGDKAVLLLHGFGGSPYELIELGEYLADRNITVYAPLLAGHGSTIDMLSELHYGEVLGDAEDALKLLQQNYDEVYVGGICNGGLTTLYLAENYNFDGAISLSTPLYVSFKWLDDSVALNVLKTVRYVTKYARKITYGAVRDKGSIKGMPVFEGAPITEMINVYELTGLVRDYIDKIDEPLLIVQSTFDNRAAPESAQLLYDQAASEDKELIWLENSGHIITVDYDKEEVFEETYKFIEKKK